MRAKRLDHRAVFVAVTLFLAPSVVSAQFDGRAFRLPPGGSSAGARGVVQKPQPQVIVVQPSAHRGRVNPHRQTVFPRQSSVLWVPAVVTSDGRVFANFGYGFEQVYRSCASAVVVGQPTVVAGNGVVLSPQTPTYTQPVPNQQTASQQMAAGSRAQTTVVAPAYSTCFSPHSSGGVIVYRF
jgi:hypothetical protein